MLNVQAATIAELAQLIHRREISPVALTESYLERVRRLDPGLNAYITLCADQALAGAAHAEREIQQGRYRGPLHGMPFSIKDNLATTGVRTTAGSTILGDWIPRFDATAVQRLKDAGVIVLGKTNMHEWALGGTTINPFYGTTHNPWNSAYIAGGSSGGSAAAVAAGLCAASIGTDSAQSVRNPAAMCGIVGLKPTYGRISQHGTVAGTGAYSTNHTGILARTVADCAVILQALAGHDPKDPLSARQPVPDYSEDLGGSVKGVKAAILRGYFDQFTSGEVAANFSQAVAALQSLGVEVEEATTAHMDLIPAIKVCTSRVENAAAHDAYLRTRAKDYSKATLYSYISALMTPASTYVMAQRARRIVCDEFEELLRRVQILILPTVGFSVPSIEDCQKGFVEFDGRRLARQDARGGLESLCCIPFNVTGLPAISVCSGFSESGLPIGLQIAAGAFQEARLLQVTHAYEQAAGWFRRRPALSE